MKLWRSISAFVFVWLVGCLRFSMLAHAGDAGSSHDVRPDVRFDSESLLDSANDVVLRDSSLSDGAPVDSLSFSKSVIRSKIRGIRALLRNELPTDMLISELFSFNVLDEHEVEKKLSSLRNQIVSMEGNSDAGANSPSTASAEKSDGWVEKKALQLEWLLLQVQFLERSRDVRQELVRAEMLQQRISAEQERLQTERKKAEEDSLAASQARQLAFAEADRAKGTAQRNLANERARLEDSRSRVAAFRLQQSEAAVNLSVQRQGWQAKRLDFRNRIVSLAADAEKTKSLYAELLIALADSHAQMRSALLTLEKPPSLVVTIATRADLVGLRDAEAQELEEQFRALVPQVSELNAAEIRLARERLLLAEEHLRQLALERRTVFLLLPPSQQFERASLRSEGNDEAFIETAHVILRARLAWLRVREWGASVPSYFRSPGALISITSKVMPVGLSVLLFFFVRKRIARALALARKTVPRLVRSQVLAKPLAVLLRAIHTLSEELLLFACLPLVPNLFGSIGEHELFKLLYRMLWAYAWYAFSVEFFRVLVHVLSPNVSKASEPVHKKILFSIHLFARSSLLLVLFWIAIDHILGRGFFTIWVIRIANIGLIPAAFLLVRTWRPHIVDAYLRASPQGRLAASVARSRDRWYGFFVAVLAFLVLFAQWMFLVLRAFVLRFDQSRKALAFLFRRRLEKQTEQRASTLGGDLAEEVKVHFSEAPITQESYTVDRFPGLKETLDHIKKWKSGKAPSSVLVVGKTGMGKTSWLSTLKLFAEKKNNDIVSISIESHLRSSEELCLFLCKQFGVPETKDTNELIASLCKTEGRLVLMDDVHKLILRAPMLMETWHKMLTIIEATREKIFWVATISKYSYEYIVWAFGGLDAFRRLVHLEPWTEQEIRDLLHARLEPSGWFASYDDLVVDRIEGVGRQAELMNTEHDYLRLIWDYAEGSPRVAIFCFRKSMTPDFDRKRLRIRLFKQPNFELLENLTDPVRFVLAAVVWHGSLTAKDAESTLRYRLLTCEHALALLEDFGVVEETDGRFVVSTAWWPGVVRYLRRKHLIED